MGEYFTNRFFPGPALALIGILLAVAGYVNFDGFAASSVELGCRVSWCPPLSAL